MNMEWKRCLVVNGQPFASIDAAREALLIGHLSDGMDPDRLWKTNEVAALIVEHRQAVLDALTLSEKSRPGARGKTKKRSNGVALRNVPSGPAPEQQALIH